MSLIFIDLVYLGIKGICSIGYYTLKYGYNTIAYLSGSEPIVDKEVIDINKLVLEELKELRKEISILKNNKQLNIDELYSKNTYIDDNIILEETDDNILYKKKDKIKYIEVEL